MALGWKKSPEPTDPRLKGHETTYSSSRGGWVKRAEKPVPGTPKKG
ncbi:hypothetical protein [Streptomyces rubradiris]|uniref:Uncharacterized protein n=1 Tax=Streptomyces rubradiris TaxID=285531 RepID=A0ABQ3R3I8_STRRR|nr:hypothetical protein [Streptomyces rubradiris]GHH30165.1 hypothetical protein GCM10018792_76290 [Streptomyces rubradiris]GHI50410.1 hypothetical protein Srubr_02560 [Streptomyces rubradiris]